MANIQRRPSGIYIARLAVPPRLQRFVGVREFIETTGSRHWAMAKVIASAKVAAWRQQLFDLDRLALTGAPMDHESILKIADGHPLLAGGGYLPLDRAAAASGITVSDLLRHAADGRLDLFLRLASEPGYVAPFGAFEPDDPELGTFVIPTLTSMPAEARKHTGSGVFRIPREDAQSAANQLLAEGKARVVVLASPTDASTAFVPEKSQPIDTARVEVLASSIEKIRAGMAATITPGVLEAARAIQQNARSGSTVDAKNSARLLSDAIDAYARDLLPRTITSAKEIERIRTGISLLVEFEGDCKLGDVDADRLRHFRDHHLSRMPAQENRIRLKYKTTSVTESIAAVAGTNWPRMSAAERDLRMSWLSRIFGWFHRQKWIADDPSTGLKHESVQTKAQKVRTNATRKDREEFTPSELQLIFSAPWFKTGTGVRTKEGTFREFQPFHYWLPLLGLFTGARIGELTQLYLDDVGQTEGGTWFIDINIKTPDKSLKNESSARRVPLHNQLVELGLPLWCQRLKSEGYKRLFPELSWNQTNRYAKDPIRVMSQYLQGLGLPRDGTKVFHSFRHGMNNALQKRSAMPDIMRKRLLGHEAGSSVNEQHYLSDPTPDALASELNALSFGLPRIGGFDVDAGIVAVKDALRRKDRGRGSGETLG